MTYKVRRILHDNCQVPRHPLVHGGNELLEVIFDEILEEADRDASDVVMQLPPVATAAARPVTADFAVRPIWCVPHTMISRK